MEMSILLKNIKDSVSYGLSNKKSGTWGTILRFYTFSWVLWTLFFILVGMDMEEGILTSIFV
jgi:hypothetical protein